MIAFRWLITAFLLFSFPRNTFAAPSCQNNQQTIEIKNLCQHMVEQCQDVPERKRISCGANPWREGGAGVVGCFTGVFKSAKDLVGALYQIAKFIVTLPIKAGEAVYDIAKDPNAAITKARQLNRAQALSVAQLQSYIAREFAVTEHNMGLIGRIPGAAAVAATPAVIKKIVGPIFQTIAVKIEEFAEQQIHNFACYNEGNQAEMLCRVASDLLLPPTGAMAILKGGGRELLKEFPNMEKAFSKISSKISSERDAAASARLEKVSAKAKAELVPSLTRDQYQQLDAEAFHTAERDFFRVGRGSPEASHAENERILKDMKSFPQPPLGNNRKSGLSRGEIEQVYRKVSQNEVASVCSVRKYDPKGQYGFCFGRATAAHLESIKAGLDKNQIRKVWAVGHFTTGSTHWRYHVTTVVRGVDGEWYTVDPIFGHPVKLQDWYAEMKRMQSPYSRKNMRLFSTRAERFSPDYTGKYDPKEFKNPAYNNYFNDLMETMKEPR